MGGCCWIGEYGDRDDPKIHALLEKYAPFQNVKANVHYPRIDFKSSMKDDRVSPAHARKMVAKMQSQGHGVVYFENTEGGHSAAADLGQQARRSTCEFTCLWSELQ